MGMLRLLEANFRELRVGERRLLFHVPTAALFELDGAGARVLAWLRERGQVAEESIPRELAAEVPAREVLADFRALGIVGGSSRARTETGAAAGPRPCLSTLVLNVTSGCNLRCRYCYREHRETPADGKRMNFATAASSVDLLLEEGAPRSRLAIVFFGGEPLINFPLIRRVVDYAEQRSAALGKRIDFSLTTNALLLTPASIDYLDAHRFGLTVSIDGPRPLHDRNRRSLSGAGTYGAVAKNARMLLARYRSRPVGARVTLAAGAAEVETIFDHLRYELGFAEVGLAPVSADDAAPFGLDQPELGRVFEGMKRLGERYQQAALRGEYLGFSNLHRLLGDLYRGTRKAAPCGAGSALMAVDTDGSLHLCHRFTGSDLPALGAVGQGIDKQRLGALLDQAGDLSGWECARCHARALCRGGCYHERYRRYRDARHPCYHYCDLIRAWIEFGIAAYSRISQGNPEFFRRYMQPRRYADMRGVRP